MSVFDGYDPSGGLYGRFSRNLNRTEIQMTEKYVAESIGEQYKSWHYKDPVFIDAPTGTRKSTFVFEKIIPYALEKCQHVLIVSNRIALSAQQKRKIVSVVGMYAPETISGISSNSEMQIVDDLVYFGPVCVATYQGIHKLLNASETDGVYTLDWFRKLRYAVFDEIHFLYSDALFNSCCGYLLQKIPVIFRNAIRIYMTATSWEVKELIFGAEQDVWDVNEKLFTLREKYLSSRIPTPPPTVKESRIFYDYCMTADYSAYRLHFFSDEEYSPSNKQKNPAQKLTRKKYLLALLDHMNPLPSQNNKWLIFVDKKNTGLAVTKALQERGVSVAYIDSQTKQPLSAWKKLIAENKVEQSVLCATPVIECGVNVEDPSVKHIAILCTDRTAFIQLLGRKRRSPDEIVDLWVWLPDQEYFEKMRNKIRRYLILAEKLKKGRNIRKQNPEQYVEIAKTLWNERKNLDYDPLFYIDRNGLFAVNEYVEMILLEKHNALQELADPMHPLSFQTVAEGWLGITTSEIVVPPTEQEMKMTVRDKIGIAELETILKRKISREMSEVAFKPIRQMIVTLALEMGIEDIRASRREHLSAKPLNRILEKVGLSYTVSKSKKLWKITKK